MSSIQINTFVADFVAAQRALVKFTGKAVDAETARQDAFRVSAVAASVALSNKVTLQRLADENAAATAKIVDSAPKGTLYVSVEAVAVHALTGDVLRKPDAEGEDVKAYFPTSVQTVVNRVKRSCGVRPVKAAIRAGKSVQDVLERLAKLEAEKKETDAAEAEAAESGVDAVEPDAGAEQILEALLSRAVLEIEGGTSVNDAVRELIGRLTTLAGSEAAAA